MLQRPMDIYFNCYTLLSSPLCHQLSSFVFPTLTDHAIASKKRIYREEEQEDLRRLLTFSIFTFKGTNSCNKSCILWIFKRKQKAERGDDSIQQNYDTLHTFNTRYNEKSQLTKATRALYSPIMRLGMSQSQEF